MNILIIEDDDIQSQLIKRYLKSKLPSSLFYDANDGIEALELTSIIKIDLILLDMSMPRMNGMEYIGKLKQTGLNIPFIVISGGLSGSIIGELYTKGAIECIKKPFFLEELFNKISRVQCAS